MIDNIITQSPWFQLAVGLSMMVFSFGCYFKEAPIPVPVTADQGENPQREAPPTKSANVRQNRTNQNSDPMSGNVTERKKSSFTSKENPVTGSIEWLEDDRYRKNRKI